MLVLHLYKQFCILEQQFRLSSFILRTYSTDGTLIETYKEPGNAQSVYEVWLTNTSVGISRLTVTAQGVLTLCEVEAYGGE